MGTMHAQHHAIAHSNLIHMMPNHTSSLSASNPLLQLSFDNSSQSSLKSIVLSYHSSDGEMEDKKAKMLMTLLLNQIQSTPSWSGRGLGGLLDWAQVLVVLGRGRRPMDSHS